MQDLQSIQTKTQSIIKNADDYVVNTEQVYKEVGKVVKLARDLKSQIKEFFNPTIENFKRAKAEADRGRKEEIDKMNEFLDPIVEAESVLSKKCKAFEDEQERLFKEKQRIADEAAKKKADKEKEDLLAQAENEEYDGNEVKANALLNQAEEVTEVGERVVPEFKKQTGLGIRRTYKWRVIDENKIPRGYMNIDLVSINAVVRTQKEKTSIPGIEVYYE